jgi:hypothetical protein
MKVKHDKNKNGKPASTLFSIISITFYLCKIGKTFVKLVPQHFFLILLTVLIKFTFSGLDNFQET